MILTTPPAGALVVPDKERFANNLRVLRRKAGLTQAALADRIGRSRATVVAWEDPAEPNMPSEADVLRVAAEVGVTARDLRYNMFDAAGAPIQTELYPAAVREPRYRGRDLPRAVDVIAKRFEVEAMEAGATDQEMGVIRQALYSPETVLMFSMGYEGPPMNEEEQRVEIEALAQTLRVWLKERIRRRTKASKRR